uniref:UBC core domain-containing protein n=1 Tax=Panagrellus redivivus TaxID=6233 RepID=A0A7E4UNN2_PANRE
MCSEALRGRLPDPGCARPFLALDLSPPPSRFRVRASTTSGVVSLRHRCMLCSKRSHSVQKQRFLGSVIWLTSTRYQRFPDTLRCQDLVHRTSTHCSVSLRWFQWPDFTSGAPFLRTLHSKVPPGAPFARTLHLLVQDMHPLDAPSNRTRPPRVAIYPLAYHPISQDCFGEISIADFRSLLPQLLIQSFPPTSSSPASTLMELPSSSATWVAEAHAARLELAALKEREARESLAKMVSEAASSSAAIAVEQAMRRTAAPVKRGADKSPRTAAAKKFKPSQVQRMRARLAEQQAVLGGPAPPGSPDRSTVSLEVTKKEEEDHGPAFEAIRRYDVARRGEKEPDMKKEVDVKKEPDTRPVAEVGREEVRCEEVRREESSREEELQEEVREEEKTSDYVAYLFM